MIPAVKPFISGFYSGFYRQPVLVLFFLPFETHAIVQGIGCRLT
jgi:hypothetical protein